MKLLLIHSDFIEYETKKKAGRIAEDIPDERKTGRLEDALTAFIAVESVDEADPGQAVAQAAHEIRDVAAQVKAARVMIYPYAHLSKTLGDPDVAKQVLADLETELASDFEVKRSPFGWYKAFTIKCKGHPLSELSRDIQPGLTGQATAASAAVKAVQVTPKPGAAPKETVSDALQKEATLRSEWHILTPEGDLVPATDFDFKGHADLQTFYEYESAKVRSSKEEAPHVRLMRELELVDYEPGSDSGNFRWYPKGQLVKRLLEAHVRDICQRHGAMQVETPIMYDIKHPALAKYLHRFPARQYRVMADDREFFLRFAACFGQYLIAKDMTMSYKQLPLKLLEITHYSFRREQRGELTGIKRLRAFTMPDMHSFVADMKQGIEEFQRQFDLSQQWMKDLDLPYEAGIRIVRDFYEEHKEFYAALAKKMGKPVLVELWNDRFFYFVTKFEFNVVDALGKAAALSTVQIDVENAERFDIDYTDAKGKKQRPLILHASISGSIDRDLYILLEREWMRIQGGQKPMLPFWLSPTQVRVIPLNDEFVEAAAKVVRELESGLAGAIRVDLDDRTEGVGRKIRDAEKEWIPVILVVGDKEKGGVFQPRIRRATLLTSAGFDEAKKEFSLDEIVSAVATWSQGKPAAALALAQRLSQRPVFRG